MADYFGVTLDYLDGISNRPHGDFTNAKPVSSVEMISIPVLKEIPNGIDVAAVTSTNGNINLKDGHCSLSNNWSEISINLVIVGRKNWLFGLSVVGAEASTNIYIIFDMAKIHGLNRQKYLEYILEHSSDAEMTDEELALLAPWNKGVQEACGKCDH